MGRNTRIVLLTITTVLAVCVFAAMLAVRPGQENAVLDAARARQSTPLLSIPDPLETDVKTLSEEEKMAEKVSSILKGDDAFLSAMTAKVEAELPSLMDKWAESTLDTVQQKIDSSIASIEFPDNTEYVDKAVSEVYAGLKAELDGISASFSARIESSISDMASKGMTKEEIEQMISDPEYIAGISESVAADLGVRDDGSYRKVIDRIVDQTLQSIVIPSIDFNSEFLDAYGRNRDYIADDIISSIPSPDIENALLELYPRYRQQIADDIISMIPAVDYGKEAEALYEKYRSQIIEDLSSSFPEIDIESEAAALYQKHRSYIIDDIRSALELYSEPQQIPAEASLSAEEAPAEEASAEPAAPSEVSAVPAPPRIVIGAPSFTEPYVTDPSKYVETRNERRQREIDRVLSTLSE
ncbi:MAG: hypothetical protein SPJ34_03285 [Candidatus Ornithospirochaeta sp.]|nr:hypothetical protein [Candidatus Ornithospirochaeta sp.]